MTRQEQGLMGGIGGYGIGKLTPLGYDAALAKIRETLQQQRFGILTEIDITETLAEKIGAQLGRRYIILGACNPHLAYEALTAEPELGLLLPCNVVVAETDEGTYVGAVDPHIMLGVASNEALEKVAEAAREGLTKAVDAV